MSVQPWTVEQAGQWYARQPWLRGCNFIPSNAINQLEMWQAETFDPVTIDRELGWGAELGFNTMRVYLHDLLWKQDPSGFLERLRRYLDIAWKHRIRTVFVLFDDCWHDDPQLGKQPDPTPGVHNSGWLRSPGSKVLRDEREWDRLEEYVRGVVGAFASDERVLMWDIYNEPGNGFLISLKLPKLVQFFRLLGLLMRHVTLPMPTARLVRRAFTWARASGPGQPLTCGTWYLVGGAESCLNNLAVSLSDMVTFHSYSDLALTVRHVEKLKLPGRPLICTEYMARGAGCTFQSHMPWFKEHKIGCLNWGLVSGKTQTKYSWKDYYPNGEEPPLWFHDTLHPDGSPYRKEEVEFIRGITSD